MAFQRRWSELRPDSQLNLLRVNSATAGLAEGVCDLAVVRRPVEDRRLDVLSVEGAAACITKTDRQIFEKIRSLLTD